MGFGSKRKTSVGTSVTRVLEDELLPNSLVSGPTSAVIEDNNVAFQTLDYLVEGMAYKTRDMYRHAIKHKYPYGLPGEVGYTQSVAQKQARDVLQGILGMDVNIVYSVMSSSNAIHQGWEILQEKYNYNSLDNTVSYSHPDLAIEKPGEEIQKVYLDDMRYQLGQTEADIIGDDIYQAWGIQAGAGEIPVKRPAFRFLYDVVLPLAPEILPGSRTEKIIFYFTKVTKEALEYNGPPIDDDIEESPFISAFRPARFVTVEVAENLPVLDPDDDSLFLNVCYTIPNGQRKYWSYRLGTGTYYYLDILIDKGIPETNTFLPFTYFRFSKVNPLKYETSHWERSSTELLDVIGLDFKEITEAVHENPDIKDVEQAMMVFSVPANTKNQYELRYLFDYFARWQVSVKSPSTSIAGAQLVIPWGISASRQADIDRQTIEIRDKRFRMTLSHQGIIRKVVAGTIGPVGSYALERGNFRTYYTRTSYSGGDSDTTTVTEIPVNNNTHVYKKQISANMVEQLTVLNMEHTYYIWRGHKKVGEAGDEYLMVPLDMSITSVYPLPVREQLYTKSLQFVFNSRVTRKVQWYQRGIFKVVLVIAAIAIVIVTKGAAIKAAFAALAAGGAAATAAAISLFKGFLLSIAITAGTKLVVKAVGIRNALILAAITIAASMYGPEIGGLDSSLYAGDLLTAGTGLVNSAQDAMQDKLISIGVEMSALQKEMEEATKTLETANALLLSSPILTPFIYIGESPQDYYNRTVHSGNMAR